MPVRLEIEKGVALVTLDRPESLNAIDIEMRDQLRAAFERINTDRDIRVAIITGEGERAFCAGVSLKKSPTPPPSLASEEFGGSTQHLLAGFPTHKASIAAINGFALGGGLEIALGADIRIASDRSSFGLPEVRIGSIPGSGGTQLLPRFVGVGNALKLILTGERITANQALQIGLVQEVVPHDDLMDRAIAIGETIAKNAPLAVTAAKKLIHRAIDTPLEIGLDAERYAFGLLRETEDRSEGRRAFAEKRDPQFKGR